MSDDQKPKTYRDTKTPASGEVTIITKNLAEINGIMLFGNLEKTVNSLPITNDWPFTEEEAQKDTINSLARKLRMDEEISSYDLSNLSISDIENLFSRIYLGKNYIEYEVFSKIMEKINLIYPDLVFEFIQNNISDFGKKFIADIEYEKSMCEYYFVRIIENFQPKFATDLMYLLDSNNIDSQRQACFLMSNCGVKEAIPKILDMAKNHEWYYVKYDAITALGIFADESVISDLIELQKDHTFVHEDRTIAMVATQAIEQIYSKRQ